MQLYITPSGTCRSVYDETLDLRELGEVTIRRASHVEPTPDGHWTADMSPLGGPSLGPFPVRSAALLAEQQWLAVWFYSHHGEVPK